MYYSGFLNGLTHTYTSIFISLLKVKATQQISSIIFNSTLHFSVYFHLVAVFDPVSSTEIHRDCLNIPILQMKNRDLKRSSDFPPIKSCEDHTRPQSSNFYIRGFKGLLSDGYFIFLFAQT